MYEFENYTPHPALGKFLKHKKSPAAYVHACSSLDKFLNHKKLFRVVLKVFQAWTLETEEVVAAAV